MPQGLLRVINLPGEITKWNLVHWTYVELAEDFSFSGSCYKMANKDGNKRIVGAKFAKSSSTHLSTLVKEDLF